MTLTNWTGRNWAGNVVYSARAFHAPRSVDELQELVAGISRVRAVGTGHSFNRIADTDGDLVSTAALPPRIEIADGSVTVSSGLRFGEITGPLAAAGLTLPNMGSLPHISVAGACATGTHGSGDANTVLAAYVSAVEVVGADGELRRFRRGADGFPGAVLALGAIGVVTALTLDVVPDFRMRQWVFEGVRDLDAVDEVLAAGYSVSAFTGWGAEPGFDQVWVKVRDGDPAPGPGWLGATPATAPRHMAPGQDPRHTTPQLGEPGPAHTRLPHFRPEFTPSSGSELQSEYFVARADAPAALRALAAIAATIRPVLQVCEVRSVAADDLWLSGAAGRDTVAVHFTWDDTPAAGPVVAAVEQALAPFDARPHWAKVFAMSPQQVARLWPRLPAAAEFVRAQDPAGVFRNDLTARFLG